MDEEEEEEEDGCCACELEGVFGVGCCCGGLLLFIFY